MLPTVGSELTPSICGYWNGPQLNWAADVTHAALLGVPGELGGVLGLALPPMVELAALEVVADGDGLAGGDVDVEPTAALVSAALAPVADADVLAVADLIVIDTPAVGDVAFSAVRLW